MSIFDVKPNVVTRDLSGKSFLFYGERKSGKTTNACKFPKHILLAFEKGYGLIPRANGYPINSWREALEAKRDLLKDAKEVEQGKKAETFFKTVIVDTADIAYDMCERFILDKEGVEYLDETEKMRGYRAVSREFDKFFQDIVRAGYTLVCISHATSKQIKEKGEKYDKTIPTLPDRGFLVISRLVDVCGYASYETDENGHTTSMLTLRGSKYLEAGSRNKYMSDCIPFTYEALCADMAQAIDKLEKNDGATVTDESSNLFVDKDERKDVDFPSLVGEIKAYAIAMHKAEKTSEYNKIVTEYLGKGRAVKDCDESQTDMLLLILDELRDWGKENGVDIERKV